MLRTSLRNALVLIAVLLTSPLWLLTLAGKAAFRSDGMFLFCTEFLSMAPGKTGIFLRRGYYAPEIRAPSTHLIPGEVA